ncbi:hypothetical protein ET475_08820 [Microbacterium protaetiae]|uniref:Transposase n=1 Tax=Microbacterium protaetiae TaxID=2509458 RepID=A0A4P6ECW7_9MICO|nr:hypothetical protein [Microbacterium protaetiae]QAY60080.1 hypothetical protein ET475_08820 [Microbacterium protaetiae]
MTDDVWAVLLDRFEADLRRNAIPQSWTPPSIPLSAAHAERARELLQRQRQRRDQLQGELNVVREQLRALRRVPPVHTDSPILLDRHL